MFGSKIRKWYQTISFLDRMTYFHFIIISAYFLIVSVAAYLMTVRALMNNSTAAEPNDIFYQQALVEAVWIFIIGLIFSVAVAIMAHKLIKKFQNDLKIITDNLLNNTLESHDLPVSMPFLEELNLAVKSSKISQNTLRQMEEIFYRTFRYSPVLKAIISLKDGKFFEVNDQWLKVMGRTREEVIGQAALELPYNNLDDKEIKELYETIFIRKEMVCNLNRRFITQYGQIREGFFTSEIVDIGYEPYVFIVCVDVTEINRMEKEMAQLENLNLLGQMAASIGHEIRNPVTTIRGFLQLLQRKEKYSDDEKYLQLMISELDRANAIITEFLSLAGKKTSVKKPLNLNNTIQSIYPLLQAQAIKEDKKVELYLNEIPPYEYYENEMRQVILNLVNNALDAVRPQGTVTITTKAAEAREQALILMIEDNGCGIPAEIMSQLGTPFVTTKEKGTGLGLAVCYDIVERHQGRIEVRTNPCGTLFTLIFPLEEAAVKIS